MTRDRIADGLLAIILQLANDRAVPDGWTPWEWAYVCGLASGELSRLRDRLVPEAPAAPRLLGCDCDQDGHPDRARHASDCAALS